MKWSKEKSKKDEKDERCSRKPFLVELKPKIETFLSDSLWLLHNNSNLSKENQLHEETIDGWIPVRQAQL